jgi:hypothetical protein
LIVTRLTPVTAFIPSLSIALRLFFSLLVCLDLPDASPSNPAIEKEKKNIASIIVALVHAKKQQQN